MIRRIAFRILPILAFLGFAGCSSGGIYIPDSVECSDDGFAAASDAGADLGCFHLGSDGSTH